MSVQEIFLLLLALIFIYPTLFQSTFYILGKRQTMENKTELTFKNIDYVVLLPVKREPAELIEEFLKRNKVYLERAHLVLIIADEYQQEERLKLAKILEKYSDLKIEIIFRERSRSKGDALNFAISHILNKLPDDVYVLVLDVDSVVRNVSLKGEIYALCPRWEGYVRGSSFLGLGQVYGYKFYMRFLKGLSRALGWSPLFGSGLLVKLSVLRKVNLFRNDVILEDIDLSIRLTLANIHPKFEQDFVVQVQVPALYTSFRRQQARWCYGVGELLALYLKELVKFDVKRLTILLYLLQYLAYPSILLYTVFTYLLNMLSLTISMAMEVLLLVLVISSLSLYTFLIVYENVDNLRDLGRVKHVLTCINRVNMAFTLMSGILLVNIVRGLARVGYMWIPTPKVEVREKFITRSRYYAPEVVTLTLLMFLLLLNVLLSPYSLLSFHTWIALAFTVSYIWAFIRCAQRDLA